jgi:CDGSH-type Zn-finger protein/uncharacterized Fe-S cluster protein YjdI
MTDPVSVPSREQLLHGLYEAAELEHNLMCTYLYAAFSLRVGEAEGLSSAEAIAVARWRSEIIRVAIEEMGHLANVWNITAALGGSPRFGRGNFPLDPGMLPAGIVVRLAPFNEAVLQHFIHLERPADSLEADGAGFTPEFVFTRGITAARLTPMPLDYDTVGVFYNVLGARLSAFAAKHGEEAAFCGDPALQLSAAETALVTKPVICVKTALAAFNAIVEQGEGAALASQGSHYRRFADIRSEFLACKAQNPGFEPAFPAAVNPVLRRPMRPGNRVWIEDEVASETVDLANTGYMLMLRLIAYAYVVPRPLPHKALAMDLSLGLMRAVTLLAEAAARLPAGPSHPECHAGMSFTILRDSAPLPFGASSQRYFIERFDELAEATRRLESSQSQRTAAASRQLDDLARRARRGFELATAASQPAAGQRNSGNGTSAANGGGTVGSPHGPNTSAAAMSAPAAAPSTSTAAMSAAVASTNPSGPGVGEATIPVPVVIDGVEHIDASRLSLLYETKRCIHARFCVTGAPSVFLANVKGPWIRPDAIPVERMVEIAHACPSGAIRYHRKDGLPDEDLPPVNLISIREAGPYAVRADLRLEDAADSGRRATLCRCGASRNKPFCDSSHRAIDFSASGEPPSGATEMLAERDGPLEISPQLDGPLQVRGNLEITSGTGRVVARLTSTRLCRCGGSANKPFCDGTHARIGFRST